MPITIKELLASDTISQAADKINFNFDQLILNGGGPEGPVGPQGPIGPIGGRGKRGSLWYEDPNVSPGTNPNTIIFADLLEGDNYLQSDGTVWEYNGTVWVTTPVNLTGPQGPTGVSAGFGYFGQSFPLGENTIYPLVMPSGASGGANFINEGVPSLMVGGVVSLTSPVIPPPAIPFTNAYLIDNSLAQSIASNVTSLFIHQKDSSSTAITFHGGAAVPTDKFETSNISNLSTIGLGEDDKLKITVPKPPTTPSGPSDLVGLEINTANKSQQYFAGKAINFYTGIDSTVRTASEVSDFDVQINQSNASIPPKFSVSVASPNSILQLGGSITLPGNPSVLRTGKFLLSVQDSEILTSGVNSIISTGAINIRSNNSNVNITATTGVINNNAINIQNTATSGIANDVTGVGNITNSIFNGAFNITVGAGVGNQPTPPPNLAGYSYIYSINGITLETEGTGSNILATARGSISLTSVFGDIIANSGDEITTSSVRNTSISSLRRITLQASGPIGSGEIILGTTLDDINVTSGRNINILTGTTGASGTFDLGAGVIDMFSTANTVITASTNMNLNATGSSSVMTLTSGNNITVTANTGANGIIQINSKTLDINSSIQITADAPLINITSTIATVISSSGGIGINGTGTAGVQISSAKTRVTATGATAMPSLPIQTIAEISPNNLDISGSLGVIVSRSTPAITSGSFFYSLPNVVDYCTMNWIKIGAIVQVTGIVIYNAATTPSTGLGAIPLPVILDAGSGNDIGELYGHGTARVLNGTTLAGSEPKMVAVDVKQGSSSPAAKNYFVITHEPTVLNSTQDGTNVVVNSGTGFVSRNPKDPSVVVGQNNVINAKANIKFSFSYRLDN